MGNSERKMESRAGEISEIYIICLLLKSVSCEGGRYGKIFLFRKLCMWIKLEKLKKKLYNLMAACEKSSMN